MPTLPDGVIVIDLENEINTRRGRYYINDLVFKDLIHQGTELCKKVFNL